jgi:hypothetical protein
VIAAVERAAAPPETFARLEAFSSAVSQTRRPAHHEQRLTNSTPASHVPCARLHLAQGR